MKTVELSQATQSLSHYAQEAADDLVILTDHGTPVAALLGIEEEDLETLVLGRDPRFMAMIERAREDVRAGRVYTEEEVRKHLGMS